MISKACSGSRHALVIARNEPPLLAGRTGMCGDPPLALGLRHAVLDVQAAQEAPSWLGSLPSSMADSWSGVPLTRLRDDPALLGLHGERPGVAHVVLVADEVAVLVDVPLGALLDHVLEDASDVGEQEGPRDPLPELLARREVTSPRCRAPRHVGGLVRQPGLGEDVVLVEVRDRAAVDREADHRAVVGDALLPLPVQVLALVLVRAQRAQVDELVCVGQVGRPCPRP